MKDLTKKYIQFQIIEGLILGLVILIYGAIIVFLTFVMRIVIEGWV